jgi:hypothetical protein
MLTRLCAGISIAVVATGTIVALGSAPASASGPTSCGTPQHPVVCLGSNRSRPARPGTPGGGGGGGSGKPAPIPCPPGQQCGALTVGADPAPTIPTIDVAEFARAGLLPPSPTVHTTPAERTYVQLKTGLWIDAAGFRDFSNTAPPVGGQVVTAVAKKKNVTWNMGDGAPVVCETAGTPHGTSCGYTYTRSSAARPGRKYAVTVTVTWDIYWTCEGAACTADRGDFPEPTMSRTTNTTLAVGEVQTESRPG